jgi:hypothetical protein
MESFFSKVSNFIKKNLKIEFGTAKQTDDEDKLTGSDWIQAKG